jgi:LPS O-antigen subunit length determinant protein (WzzB/FepE family)
MNEKKIPLSSTPDQDQNFKHIPEDEINLFDLLEFLVTKKVIIYFTTLTSVVLSIFYAFSITPIYLATIGFQPAEKDLISLFPSSIRESLPNVSLSERGVLVIKENYMLNKFISELLFYSNQEKVFMEGKFYERFVANNPKIDIKKGIVQEINRSIHEIDGGGVSAKVVSYEMKGVNPEVASDFLNSLADWVRSKVALDIQESIQKEAKVQIALLSTQLNSRNTMKQLEQENKIRLFTDNIEIAKNLGILGNNFDNFKPDVSTFHEREKVITPSGGVQTRELVIDRNADWRTQISWPIWYLYGQRALEQELNLLERRGPSSQYTKEIADLNFKIEELSKIDLSKINLEPVIISHPSIPPLNPISTKKTNIIFGGIVFGLFIGILMALLSCLMTNLKERSKLLP